MGLQEYLGIGSIVATILVGVVSWIVSANLTKKSLLQKKLSYEIRMFSIVSNQFLNKSNELEIYYKKELLPEPTLLAIDIINSGKSSIENPPIVVDAKGTTYIIPGYIEDVPPGYEDLWSLDRKDAETCSINLEHINPGQVVKARFFLDEFPKEVPVFKCPMKDVEIKEVNTEIKKVLLESAVSVVGGFLRNKL
jgi:hypothetical protein